MIRRENIGRFQRVSPVQPVKYGLLYNGYSIVDERNITSSNDWTPLLYTDMMAIANTMNDNNSFDYMSDRVYPEAHPRWNAPNGGTNASGFNSLPGGYRSGNGNFGSIGEGSFHWMLYDGEGVSEPFWEHVRQMRQDTLWEHENFEGLQNGYSLKLINPDTLLSEGEIGTYTGNDGKIYPTKVINGIEVTTLPICETKYRNGDLIPEVTDNAAWAALTTGALCAYDNDWSNV